MTNTRDEYNELRWQIDEFRRMYVDGQDDAILREAAGALFARLDLERENAQGRTLKTVLLAEWRKELEGLIERICANRHAPLLKKTYLKYKKTHR